MAQERELIQCRQCLQVPEYRLDTDELCFNCNRGDI